jgi:hypothetical protein
MSETGTTLVQLLNRTILLFMAPILVIAPTFMALKHLRYELVSQFQADQMIAWIGPVWPVINLQYAHAKQVDPLGSSYYALLLVISIVIVGIMLFYYVYAYCGARKQMRLPATPEFVAFAVAPLLYIFFAWFDVPNTGTMAGFRVDGFGLYYFRQYAICIGVGAGVLMCLLVILRVTDEVLRRLYGREISQ